MTNNSNCTRFTLCRSKKSNNATWCHQDRLMEDFQIWTLSKGIWVQVHLCPQTPIRNQIQDNWLALDSIWHLHFSTLKISRWNLICYKSTCDALQLVNPAKKITQKKINIKHGPLWYLQSLTWQLNAYLGFAIHIIFIFREVSWVFVVVFISSVIQITFVFSICLFVLVKIITDTVWLQVALQLADILINDLSGTYHVIIQPVTMDWSTCELQIARLSWKHTILACNS